MSHTLFLTYRMKRGFGVDVVVSNIAQALRSRNETVSIGCMDKDGSYKDDRIFQVPPNSSVIRKIAKVIGADVIVAHTAPYFQILPALSDEFSTFAWEHGDPTPELMTNKTSLEAQIRQKHAEVYPAVRGVIAISRFIASDIAWPAAQIVYNGCDHVHDYGIKPDSHLTGDRPLRIGALMRLGAGEAEYKGNALLLKLFRSLGEELNLEFHLMGRGAPADAVPFVDAGYHVHLNASDAERNAYLRNLDMFVSLSLWEGFNLPLVEAQASGTLAFSIDTGAHPEVTPFVFSRFDDIKTFVRKMHENRPLLATYSAICYRFARQKFNWNKSAEDFLAILGAAGVSSSANRVGEINFLWRFWLKIRVVCAALEQLGAWNLFKKASMRIFRMLLKH